MELDPNGRTGRNHTFPYLNFFGNGFYSVEESFRFMYLDAVKGAFWNCQRSAKFRYIYPFSLPFSLSSRWNCAKNCTDSRRKVFKSLRFKHNLKTHNTIIKSINKYYFYPRIPTATKASINSIIKNGVAQDFRPCTTRNVHENETIPSIPVEDWHTHGREKKYRWTDPKRIDGGGRTWVKGALA